MRVLFSLFCRTEWGQEVYILGSDPEMGEWDVGKARKMDYYPGDVWKADMIFPDSDRIAFEYTYILRSAGKDSSTEAHCRTFVYSFEDPHGPGRPAFLELHDEWNSLSDPDSLFLTAPFVKTIFRRAGNEQPKSREIDITDRRPSVWVRLQLINPRVGHDDTVCVAGSTEALGAWDKTKARPMDSSRFPYWTLDVPLQAGETFSYNYVIKNREGSVTAYEEGPDRSFQPSEAVMEFQREGASSDAPDRSCVAVVTDNKFKHKVKWKGAGIAIPVFSIRSEKSLGVGEFLDLKGLADWARGAGFQLIQMLPINDTSAYMSWMDSYPYSCISVFALHPIYLNLESLSPLPEGMEEEIRNLRTRLNASPVLQYQEVMSTKLLLLRKIFEAKREGFLSSPEFHAFLADHGHWLKPYAAFCALRDHFHTGDFMRWGLYSRVTDEDIETLTSSDSEYFGAVLFHYFLQYHLHLQLLDASRYASERGVVLKGDVPIGIMKGSDSCWTNPGIFHMDQSAGAPPDPFSDSGQNWGFPTYDWEEMARDNFSWWQRRMTHMSDYFQMVRLDHVLGFFRIWEIPDHSYSGLMGHFNPALPLAREEFEREGIWDFDRLCNPYVPAWLVKTIFGREAPRVEAEFLEQTGPGFFRLKPEFSTQRQAAVHLSLPEDAPEALRARNESIRDGLFALISNIVLFRDHAGKGFYPRINMMETASFACLEEWMRDKLKRLYYDYFYHRQEDFWRTQGMVKLPVLKRVSPMLICGEDLGMIPKCVPEVMEELCLLGLRIQRMPSEPDQEFGCPWSYHYLTVCTTSSHDMSTIRGWWEEDRSRTERYFRTVLGREGEAPASCEPAISERIIRQHLDSPSMWAIFPIQDVLAMSGDLRRPGDPREEQINDPGEPHHLWRYRLHIPLEQLIKEDGFNEKVLQMIARSGRTTPY